MADMTRYPINRTYALAADAVAVTLAQTIDMSNLAGGSVETTAAQDMTIFACNQDDPVGKTFVTPYDEDSLTPLITATGAGVWALPSVCYNYRYIVLVDSHGGDVYLHAKS
jgi:hypothetical protein